MRLTIAVPTYNFGRFIGETLDSILPQATALGAEVLVVDGASTDDTAAVVGHRASPHLRYMRLSERGGIDADIAHAVRLASGDYVWLFSADDVMKPGALSRASEASLGDDDVILCKHEECTFEMRALREHPVFLAAGPRHANLGDHAQRRAWIGAAATTEALFSFMGSLVIRRAMWLSVEPFTEMMGSSWGIAARLLKCAERGPLNVRYVDDVWLARRGDNDSFASSGMVKRIALSIDGYLRIADRFLSRSETADVRRLLRKEWPLPIFLDVRRRAQTDPREDVRDLDRVLDAIYADPTMRNIAVRLLYHASPAMLAEPMIRGYLAAAQARRWLRRRDGAERRASP